MDERVQTVVLCGGRGHRLRQLTEDTPKVLVEVGGRPVLWHIMKMFAAAGCRDFMLALGYRGEDIRNRFGEDAARPGEWRVDLVDTGDDTGSGGRIKRLESRIHGDQFYVAYGDGLSNIDLRALLAAHRANRTVATMTVVRPRLPFGLVELGDRDTVVGFAEKPRMDAWINGGFFVFDRAAFDYLDPDGMLEETPLQRMAADGQLAAYRHDGYWECMDTFKDVLELNAAWDSGEAPWRTWRDD